MQEVRSRADDLQRLSMEVLFRRGTTPSATQPAPSATKKTKTGQLILLRHGESLWNDKNRFTGWANVPLTSKGREQALEAAAFLLEEEGLQIDACYTSVLTRSVETASICLDAWEQAGRPKPEVYARWRLNERHYGMLTGLNKREALDHFSATDLREWRASFDGRPPAMELGHPHYSRTSERYERLLAARTRREGEPEMSVLSLDDVPLTESLADTVTRVGSLWEAELLPQVQSGKNLLVVGHANCLRALISCIQGNLRDEHLPSLGVPNALPLVYEFAAEDGRPLRGLPDRCYIRPLDAHYLGEACILFNELDADGSGALDASEFDDSAFCSVVWDDSRDDAASGDDSAAAAEEVGFASSCGESLLAEADNNNDGVVDFNEYMNWWSKLDSRSSGARRAPSRGAGRFRDTL